MTTTLGVTRLGFGCASVPGPLTRREALALLETAVECGVRHFDTARMYCEGRSEALLGEFARQHPGALAVVTKVGISPANRFARRLSRLTPLPGFMNAAPRMGRFAPEQVRQSLETSLRQLQLECVDALLLHEIRLHDVSDELKLTLETLRQQGKIAAWGIATSVEETESLIAGHPQLCDIVQVPAAWLDLARPLPAGALPIVHSVLGARLAAFLARLAAEPHLAQRLREQTGLAPTDKDAIGRLMLRASAMAVEDGVMLFSTLRPERLRRNCGFLAAEGNAAAARALARLMRKPDPAQREKAG